MSFLTRLISNARIILLPTVSRAMLRTTDFEYILSILNDLMKQISFEFLTYKSTVQTSFFTQVVKLSQGKFTFPKNPLETQPVPSLLVPFHLIKVIVWCRLRHHLS